MQMKPTLHQAAAAVATDDALVSAATAVGKGTL